MPEGEECGVCGRGAPPEPTPEPERSPLQEATRKARGELTGDEVAGAIQAFNRGQQGESSYEVTDLGDGRFAISRSPGYGEEVAV
jgi:hypothetical protein